MARNVFSESNSLGGDIYLILPSGSWSFQKILCIIDGVEPGNVTMTPGCLITAGAEGPEPPRKLLPTTDYLYNLTGRNISDWLVKTTDKYIHRRCDTYQSHLNCPLIHSMLYLHNSHRVTLFR